MAELDADFVPCACPTSLDVHGLDVRPAEFVDARPAQYRGVRLLRTLCCGLAFAVIPPGRAKPRGYLEVEPVRLRSGEVVRRLAILARTRKAT